LFSASAFGLYILLTAYVILLS